MVTISQINKIGEKLKDISYSEHELHIFSERRALHNHILKNFQKIIRWKIKILKQQWISERIIVAQRLKRLPSIIQKLKKYGTRLSKMQDIWWIRIIVDNLDTVFSLRDRIQNAQIKHELIREDNYIAEPKIDWYRSLHLTYKYLSKTQQTKYNWLFLEIQIRTTLQHIRATAIETADTMFWINLKWWGEREEEVKRREFFLIISKLFEIEELYEKTNTVTHKIKKEKKELIWNLKEREKNLNAIHNLETGRNNLKLLNSIKEHDKKSRKIVNKTNFFLFIIDKTKEKEKQLRIKILPLQNMEDAKKKYLHYEEENNKYLEKLYDVVLIAGKDLKELQSAYPNYLLDINTFIHKLKILLQYPNTSKW